MIKIYSSLFWILSSLLLLGIPIFVIQDNLLIQIPLFLISVISIILWCYNFYKIRNDILV